MKNKRNKIAIKCILISIGLIIISKLFLIDFLRYSIFCSDYKALCGILMLALMYAILFSIILTTAFCVSAESYGLQAVGMILALFLLITLIMKTTSFGM